ncbi:glycosyltransferase, family 2 [Treponema primitia ZAS-2]|uniref:Glycosyltransferase, family 2 n=1 Tax=Treponema primitia (strain ATCC BAA-887 / DSM 12427 / ZAS-2) TaxID=545694 RepID=F5YQ98_TREPZ|nr:glycosyltransferase family 2 protein [Treponema primitia]AEF86511.1 glycosyltransferase, family 2 [Treponema primitia ZAS-2]
MHSEKMISASIVLYNTDPLQLQKAIASYNPSEEKILYLIDNSPEQTNIKHILNDNGNIRYYYTGKNKGYGAGHNIAIRMALNENAQYHVVLNPDLEFEPHIIDEIVEFMEMDVSIAQVMPKVVNYKKEIQYLCKLIPTPIDLIYKRFFPGSLFKKRSFIYQLKFTSYNKQMNIPCLSGCFMFFRVSALETAGIFDERFFMYAEDIDITRRMHKLYKTIYYPKVSIIHAHAAESYHSKKMMVMHIISIIKYFNKWGWIFDNERTIINKNILKELDYERL